METVSKRTIMKLDGALKGGVAGASTVGLLSQALGGLNDKSFRNNLLGKGKLKKRLKKTGSKHGQKATKQYLQLAEDLMASAAYFGFNSLSKKKNIVLKGGLLGAAAGLGNVFLNDNDHESQRGFLKLDGDDENLSSKLLKVSLYTVGGMIAGKLVENSKKKAKKKK